MVQDHLLLRVLILGLASKIACGDVSDCSGEAASYDYAAPQVAPASALPQLSSMAQIAAILNETAPGQSADPPFALYQVDSWENATQTHASAAPLKVVQTDLAKCFDTSKCPPYL